MDKINGDDGRIRTLDPQSRNLVLYPAELRHHLYLGYHKLTSSFQSVYYFGTIFYVITIFFGFSALDILAAENLNSGIFP